ncbi:MAG TPA: helix-turn-helix domain-containing protein [Flavobacteriales bacterium]|nr:helix-turn-helix domain-containing protein [Flavobacteriales bacterium]
MLSANLKFLRKQKGQSQDEVSQSLSIKRTTLSGYENGSAEPNSENLIRIAAFYNCTIDDLLKIDLSSEVDAKGTARITVVSPDITGSNLRVIATTVNQENIDNIELVPIKARAGYTSGFADPEYIRVLPTFQLPFLSANKKYRTFPIIGDSMPPVSDGSWVTGEFLQNWNFIRNGQPYIVVTKDEGIVFKIVYNQIDENGTLLLCSTNPIYEPYEIPINTVNEIWKFTHYISSELPEPNLDRTELSNTVLQLQRDVKRLQNTMRTPL